MPHSRTQLGSVLHFDFSGGSVRSANPDPAHIEPTDPKQIDLARGAYYAQLTHIDCQINRLTHALNEQGVIGNTLFIFISDHGEMLYDHNAVAKTLPYPGSAYIPFLVKLPASMEKAQVPVNNNIVELRDVMPTILETAGVNIPKTVDGKSAVSMCTDNTAEAHPYIHGEHAVGALSNHWINTGKELYVWYSHTGEEQYFDLRKDPATLKNIVTSAPERVNELRSCLIKELTGREEGYVEDGKLVAGKNPKAILQKIAV